MLDGGLCRAACFENSDAFTELTVRAERGEFTLRFEFTEGRHEGAKLGVALLIPGFGQFFLCFEPLVDLLLEREDEGLQLAHIWGDEVLNGFLDGLGDVFGHAFALIVSQPVWVNYGLVCGI